MCTDPADHVSVASVHRVRHEGGAVQSAPVPDGQHTLPARRERQLPRQLAAVGSIHDSFV